MNKIKNSTFLIVIIFLVLLIVSLPFYWYNRIFISIAIASIFIIILFFIGSFLYFKKLKKKEKAIFIEQNRKKARINQVLQKTSKGSILEMTILDEKEPYFAVLLSHDNDNNTPGAIITVFIDPANKYQVFRREPNSNISNKSGQNRRGWLTTVPVTFYSIFLGVIAVTCMLLFNKPQRQLISTCYHSENGEQIWELWSQPKSFNQVSKGCYIVKIYSQPQGKRIKKIKRSLEYLPDFDMLVKNNRIWIIGSAYDSNPVIDIYNASTFDLEKTLLGYMQENKTLQSGVAKLTFPFSAKKTDLMYGGYFEVPNNRIIQISSKHGDECYIDTETGRFYEDLDNLLLDFCLAGYDWKSPKDYIYFLTYTDNKSISTLHRIKVPEEPSAEPISVTIDNGYNGDINRNTFNNISPVYLYDENFRSFVAGRNIEKAHYSGKFYNAKIIYCDSDIVCILHTNQQESQHLISFFDPSAKLISEINLSDYPAYNQINKSDIKPYSDRAGNIIGFRIKFFGSLSFDLNTKKTSYREESLFQHSEMKKGFILLNKPDYIHFGLYYSDQLLDSTVTNYYIDKDKVIKDGNYKIIEAHEIAPKLNLPNAMFLYRDEKTAVIISFEKNENSTIVQIIGINNEGKYLFVVDGSKIPNHDYITKDMQFNNAYNYNIKTDVIINEKQATIIFEQYGAIAVDLDSGQILWTHEIDLNRGE